MADATTLDLLADPPRSYSVMPFWFWNDAIDADAIRREIAEFDARGVYGFVIHPRVGLPRSIGWQSNAMLDLMRVAIDAARERDMRVILYDEGMYPSGSSSGGVVAHDPSLACRALALQKATDALPADAKVVVEFERKGVAYRIVDRKANSVIRGLHYLDESKPYVSGGKAPPEDEPPAGDILNPRTTQMVLTLTHERFAERFGADFGKTILGVFTDEPSTLGRAKERGLRPFTTGILPELARLAGRDFANVLPSLFLDDELLADAPNVNDVRAQYAQAIRARLEETWYAPLHDWCERHGLWLMGHPDLGDEIGVQRHFHCPGQDIVWRWVEPGNVNAIGGLESTQAKCSSSAMLHAGRARNSNEMGGAFGRQTTFAEIEWITRWLFVRGVNLLIPHAFYHSVRGPRRDERPPQVGPHTPQWDDGTFKPFADACRRMSWLNATAQHVCDVAILTHEDKCPWHAARACFERQRDFNYLEPRLLRDGTARVVGDGAIEVASMRYAMLIVDGDAPLDATLRETLAPLIAGGHVIRFGGAVDDLSATTDGDELVARVRRVCGDDVALAGPANAGLRVRHVRLGVDRFVYFFNERDVPVETTATLPNVYGEARWIDLATGRAGEAVARVHIRLDKWAAALLHVREA